MYGNNEVSSIHIQKLSEEFQENCVHMINTIKSQSELSKDFLISLNTYFKRNKYNYIYRYIYIYTFFFGFNSLLYFRKSRLYLKL